MTVHPHLRTVHFVAHIVFFQSSFTSGLPNRLSFCHDKVPESAEWRLVHDGGATLPPYRIRNASWRTKVQYEPPSEIRADQLSSDGCSRPMRLREDHHLWIT